MMLAQHCRCTQCHWVVFLKMVPVAKFGRVCFTTGKPQSHASEAFGFIWESSGCQCAPLRVARWGEPSEHPWNLCLRGRHFCVGFQLECPIRAVFSPPAVTTCAFPVSAMPRPQQLLGECQQGGRQKKQWWNCSISRIEAPNPPCPYLHCSFP
jgi:hypothetical protein